MADRLSFITDYDFLNLGWSAEALAALYGGVLLALIVLVIALVLWRRHKKKAASAEKQENHLPERWREIRPDSEELRKVWQEATEAEREEIGRLSREARWCLDYLKECGKKDASYEMLLQLWSYQETEKEPLLKQMVQELADSHLEQSMAASRLIMEIQDERIVPHLLLALLQTEEYPPARVAEALSVFGALAGRSLVALYHKVEEEPRRLVILDAMGQLGKQCPWAVLEEGSRSSSTEIRKKIADLVGLLLPDNTISFLQPLIADPEGRVRAAAAAALGKLGGQEVYAILRELRQRDPDWQVKSTCQTFLTAWENNIRSQVAVDEVDLWLAGQTEEIPETEEQKKARTGEKP